MIYFLEMEERGEVEQDIPHIRTLHRVLDNFRNKVKRCLLAPKKGLHYLVNQSEDSVDED